MSGVVTANVVLCVDPGLQLFLPARRRAGRVVVPSDGTATIAHLAESVGIPATELGGIRVEGSRAEPDHRAAPGCRVELLPVPRPSTTAERFVLDVHLGRLARRLRLLGIDAAYRNDAADDDLIARSRTEHRVVLTQDRRLLCRRSVPAGAYVYPRHPDEQARDVLTRFAPPLAPWTRCTACNGRLAPVSKKEVSEQLPAGTRRCYDVFARCPACGQVYWRGAHARRIDAFVAEARAVHPHEGDGAASRSSPGP
ncbi:Mut7-C RNAse domain-containing protein [Bounagaea algeriensis]